MRDPLRVLRSRPDRILLIDGPYAGGTRFCDRVGGPVRVGVTYDFANAGSEGVPYRYELEYEPIPDPIDPRFVSRDDAGRARYRVIP